MAESPDAAPLPGAAREIDVAAALEPRGVVLRAGDGVAVVAGLERVAYEELVCFDDGALGMAFDLRSDATGVLLISGAEQVRAGEGVVPAGRLPDLPVGPATLGRVFDPLGRPLDDAGPLPEEPRLPLFRPAPEFIERKGVDEPLRTGLLVIDAAIPIGRGQRELIIGDRNVGKTAIAEDVILAQQRGDVTCVYVVVGQTMSRVLALRETLLNAGALENTAIVAADASAPPGMRYLAPYAGASVAEWFRDQGGDALVIYDDLTKHADAYRELSLLMDRPPGREAFPATSSSSTPSCSSDPLPAGPTRAAARSRRCPSSRRPRATSAPTSRPMSSRSPMARSIWTRPASPATNGQPSTSGAAFRASGVPHSPGRCAWRPAICASCTRASKSSKP
jgi:proton translocating ATP synthase F1 alpha subunit